MDIVISDVPQRHSFMHYITSALRVGSLNVVRANGGGGVVKFPEWEHAQLSKLLVNKLLSAFLPRA